MGASTGSGKVWVVGFKLKVESIHELGWKGLGITGYKVPQKIEGL